MGNSYSEPNNPNLPSSSPGGSSCPVISKSPSEDSSCPMKTPYKNPNVYNVYNQKIDPANNMPAVANQLPAESQTIPLETNRVKSTIPKGGTDDTWLYPSPQMFWNALVRKNKVEGATEEDMSTIMQWEMLHSVVHDDDPQKQREEGREPRLLRFLGRPHDLSLKARFKMLLGHPPPFDRHDWYVDRGGREVRYVIDYYHDESLAQADSTPKHLLDNKSMKSIKLDVRPALSLDPRELLPAALMRWMWMPVLREGFRPEEREREGKEEGAWRRFSLARTLKAKIFSDSPITPASTWNSQDGLLGSLQGVPDLLKVMFEPLPILPSTTMKQAESQQQKTLESHWSQISSKCSDHRARLQACESASPGQCGAISVQLQKCMGEVVCPDIVKQFDRAVQGYSQDQKGQEGKEKGQGQEGQEKEMLSVEASYSALLSCLQDLELDSRNALEMKKK